MSDYGRRFSGRESLPSVSILAAWRPTQSSALMRLSKAEISDGLQSTLNQRLKRSSGRTSHLGAAEVLALQRMVGNRSVNRWLRAKKTMRPPSCPSQLLKMTNPTNCARACGTSCNHARCELT